MAFENGGDKLNREEHAVSVLSQCGNFSILRQPKGKVECDEDECYSERDIAESDIKVTDNVKCDNLGEGRCCKCANIEITNNDMSVSNDINQIVQGKKRYWKRIIRHMILMFWKMSGIMQ